MGIDWKELGIYEMYAKYSDPEKALKHYWSRRKTTNEAKVYTCECSRRTYGYTSFYYHKKSKKHLKWLEDQENQEKPENQENQEKPDDLD
jgi:hypothetical protein